ncbi:MAG: phenazine biosynthesis protein PhzF [Ilumatobacteraceae bacterium]|nr:phenazine biosynthesis protein PhzF [Ilumatobacteraceae bacterium]
MEVLRYTAFSSDPAGGNPAGVVLDATDATDAEMLAIAAEVGFSETAFLAPRSDGAFGVRYFSPLAEVPFCGHATIATAAAYAERHGAGEMRLDTRAGIVHVSTSVANGVVTAALVSVAPRTVALELADLTDLLEALRWTADDVDPSFPPRVAYAGAWHPIIAARSRQRLAVLDYDFDALAALMAARDWTTIDLVWRAGPTEFFARNPFPPGGIVEDPATGAAAAAFGGYLREQGLVPVPSTITIRQGDDYGRRSVLTVDIPAGDGGIAVTGTAVELTA